ncbi:DUF2975 domain-containing protein [Xanthobacteraceae bacterium A53D]
MAHTLHIEAETERTVRANRMRGLSRAMSHLCLLTAVLLTVGMGGYWAATPAATLLAQAGLAPSAGHLSLPLRIGGFLISMVPLGALVFGLLRARLCFRLLARGEAFSLGTINGLRTFAIAIAVSAALKPLAGAALSLLLSGAGGGQRTLALHVGSDTLLALIFAGTVATMAWVMAEAAAIADENRQFV